MSLADTMEEARKRAIAETEIVIPKDDGLLLIYALLIENFERRFPVSDPDASAELAVTGEKIREMRASVYELTDAVIARMAVTNPLPPEPQPDRITQILAASAAIISLATLTILVVTTWM